MVLKIHVVAKSKLLGPPMNDPWATCSHYLINSLGC